jgi:hypothetical protein
MKKHILSLLLNEHCSLALKRCNKKYILGENENYSVSKIWNSNDVDEITKLGPTVLTEQVETSDPDEFFSEYYNYEHDECLR